MRHFLTSFTLFKLAVSSVPGRFVGSRLMISTAFAAILALICTSPLKAAIIDSIVKAPIVPDGDVAGAATDLVINLDTSLDPAVTGRTLLAGKTIKVVLPDAFVNNGAFPIQDFFTCPDFSQCNTAILLQGWPQYPILPSVPPGTGPAQYSLSFEGTNTIVITAEVDITPGVALAGPGIKQIHIILQGFANPAAGSYSVEVIAETGPGGAVEMGSAQVEIHPTTRPSIDVTSAFNPGSQNTIYQTTTPGALLPLAYDFLLWDGDGMALTGVEIAQSADPARALLVQAGLEIGNVMIDAPSGASDFGVFTLEPSELINAPVSLVETGRLTAFFRTGSVAGDYELLFSLHGGNSVRMFVTAVPEPPSIALTGIGLLGVMMICGHRRLRRLTGAE